MHLNFSERACTTSIKWT